MEHIGKEGYEQIMDTAGSRCLIILEGLDELAAEHRETDPFLSSLLKQHPLLENATILVTSRPHACEGLNVNRKIEVVGFGIEEIKEYVEKSLSSDPGSIQKFIQQLEEYPHLLGICYIPMSLAMVVEIFSSCSHKNLPLTLTELYQQFIVMLLQRELSKCSTSQSFSLEATPSILDKTLCRLFEGIPNEAVNVVLSLSKLAYNGIFENEINASEVKTQNDLKTIFTTEDLIHCGITITGQFDGLGLLKYAFSPEMNTGTYNFVHLTLQELLCAHYVSSLSHQEQINLMEKYFDEYPNIFIFLCGLTGLDSIEILQLVHSKLTSPDAVFALRCLYESKRNNSSMSLGSPLALNLSYNTLLPYDCLCISHALSHYPVSSLNLMGCYVGNKGVELLVKSYSIKSAASKTLEKVYFFGNNLTVDSGLMHVMKIAEISKLATYVAMSIARH